ncbi:M56 family metallopeptidase [Dyadobacter aurulentus]|uniref:M56 family metallopeptidase n=1 Tax=Dyadobacter sp. UC 10 TaxID=2605428 RepID=UPI0011F17E2D|nr:M56 family metallopeptidase [Dyadobacter sp. UC 10]KAA0990106.1 TonB family protein [Dyadobacter sp. UC 10]
MEMLTYLAKANLYLALFYGCYWLFFRQHTFFHWNRFFLLGSIGAAFLLPAITFSIPAPVLETGNVRESVQIVTAATGPAEEPFNWALVALGCYLAGVLLLIFKLSSSFRKLFLLIRHSERVSTEGFILIFTDNSEYQHADNGSFSFFKWLIVNRDDYENNPDAIIRHEYVHIRQWHSADIMLIEILKALFWFNPVLWLYKRSIQAVHEYLADVEAPNRDRYASFLVSYALKVPEQMLANHFANSSLLKNRIQMIYKNRTPKWLLAKYVLIVPLTAVTVFLTAAREHIPSPANGNTAIIENLGINIKGTVSDNNGKKVADAIVVVKGTNQGTPTDAEGRFELRNVPENASIVVSHVQFKSQEIKINKNKLIYDIILEASTEPVQANVVRQDAPVGKPQDSGSKTEKMVVVEQKPQFPGGQQAMVDYFKNNTEYPESARKAKVSGIVTVRFTVTKEGSIGNVAIVKGVGFGLDAESVRLVKNMPKWQPAIQNGKPLSVTQDIEVKFDLPGEKTEMRQGFHLPEPKPLLTAVRIARVEVEDLFNSSLAFFEPKTFKPSANPPKAEYRYTPDSSSYRFMNYHIPNHPSSVMTFQTTGKYKYHKELHDSKN